MRAAGDMLGTLSASAVGSTSLGTDAMTYTFGKGLASSYALSIAGTKVLGAQGTAIADATDAATAISQLNLLLARARAHGFIAT